MLHNTSMRLLWLALALTIGLITGICATTLSYLSGTSMPKSVMVGSGAFAGSSAFLVGLLQFAAAG